MVGLSFYCCIVMIRQNKVAILSFYTDAVTEMFQPAARYVFSSLFRLPHKIIFAQPYSDFVCRK